MRSLVLCIALVVAGGACKKSSSAGRGKDSGQAGNGGHPASSDQRDTSTSSRPVDALVKTGFSRCIEDWPTSGGSRSLKPSLDVEAPKLLWKTSLPVYTRGDVDQAGLVLSGNRLAFHLGKWVCFLNRDGTNLQERYVEGCPSGLVADEQGNVYYTSEVEIVSLDASGKARWQVATNGLAAGQRPSGPDEGCRYGLTPVLGPDGVLYASVGRTSAIFRDA